jgi:hypothetical protein
MLFLIICLLYAATCQEYLSLTFPKTFTELYLSGIGRPFLSLSSNMYILPCGVNVFHFSSILTVWHGVWPEYISTYMFIWMVLNVLLIQVCLCSGHLDLLLHFLASLVLSPLARFLSIVLTSFTTLFTSCFVFPFIRILSSIHLFIIYFCLFKPQYLSFTTLFARFYLYTHLYHSSLVSFLFNSSSSLQ